MTTTATAGADAYTIPQEFQDFQSTIRDLVQGVVAPRAAEIDANRPGLSLQSSVTELRIARSIW